MLILHCLNLKITYDCTNGCSFCFSSFMKGTVIPFKCLREAVIQGASNGCNELVLSGGEPTLYPAYLIDLIELATSLGYEKFIVQTNGYGLSNGGELLDYVSRKSLETEICISFSIHSHETSVHDSICNKDGAFDSLMCAMKNVSATNCKIYTNTVVNTRNIAQLDLIANLVLKYDPEIVQFSMMHLEEESNESVSLFEMVKAIRNLAEIIGSDRIKTEGVPYCLMYGLERCVGESMWPTTLDLYNDVDKYITDFHQLDYNMRKKMDTCSHCIFNDICMGVWKENYNEFLKLNVHPIM